MKNEEIYKKIAYIKKLDEEFKELVIKKAKLSGYFKKGDKSNSLVKTLSKQEIESFENEHDFILPLEYKMYLKNIGDGDTTISGPQLILLKNILKKPSTKFILTKEMLNQDFIFTEEVNKVSEFPSENLPYRDKTDLRKFCKENHLYFYHGMIFIGKYMSDCYDILVITGPEKGNVWYCYDGAFIPYKSKDGKPRVNFLDWMVEFWEERVFKYQEKIILLKKSKD